MLRQNSCEIEITNQKAIATEAGYGDFVFLYELISRGMFAKGYSHGAIPNVRSFMENMVYRIDHWCTIEAQRVSSIDIASAILHTMCPPSDPQKVYDVFDCIKELVISPKDYIIVNKVNVTSLTPIEGSEMETINYDAFIEKYGKKAMMEWLVSLELKYQCMGDPLLRVVYDVIRESD